jgi:hypothetical protein
MAVKTLLDGQASALTQKAIDMALAGEIRALRLCMDRLVPPRKDRPDFERTEINSAQDAASVLSSR